MMQTAFRPANDAPGDARSGRMGTALMRRGLLTLAATTLACLLPAGCRAVSNARAAVRAERAGQHHLAYDLYCEAARELPSDPVIARGIKRNADKAFEHWRRQARAALGREEHAVAWKHLMRALMIRPDHRPTARAIRDLEASRAGAVATARRAYQQKGPHTLLVRSPASRSRTPWPSGAQQDRQLARSDGRAPGASAPVQRGQGVAGSDGRPAQPTDRQAAAQQGDQDKVLATVTVSVEDRRYPRKAEAFDDVFIKVVDTDNDPDADVDIYLGRRRVRRINNWTVGQYITVTGLTGRRYRLVLDQITDRTETISLSVRRAR